MRRYRQFPSHSCPFTHIVSLTVTSSNRHICYSWGTPPSSLWLKVHNWFWDLFRCFAFCRFWHNFKKILFFDFYLCIYVSVCHIHRGACKGQRRVSELFELELEAVVTCPVSSGSWTSVFLKRSKYWLVIIDPAPHNVFKRGVGVCSGFTPVTPEPEFERQR